MNPGKIIDSPPMDSAAICCVYSPDYEVIR